MSYEEATRCDAVGCRAKAFGGSDGFVAKGWTRATITTRSGSIEADFCEEHSRPIHEAVALTKKPEPE